LTCPACDRAKTDPNCGAVYIGCHGCQIRRMAIAPHHVLSAFYGRVMEKHGPAKQLEVQAEVEAERARMAELRKQA
jgi:hypothetical protein